MDGCFETEPGNPRVLDIYILSGVYGIIKILLSLIRFESKLAVLVAADTDVTFWSFVVLINRLLRNNISYKYCTNRRLQNSLLEFDSTRNYETLFNLFQVVVCGINQILCLRLNRAWFAFNAIYLNVNLCSFVSRTFYLRWYRTIFGILFVAA